MIERHWIKHPTDAVLALEGAPVRIRMVAGEWPFVVEIDGRPPRNFDMLWLAKSWAETRAAEIEEFV